MKSSNRATSFIVKIGVLLTGLAGLVSDVLKPAFDCPLLLLILMCVLAAGSFAVYLCGKIWPLGTALNQWLVDITGGLWFKKIFGALLAGLCVIGVIFYFGRNDPDGFLADHSKAIAGLQESLGLLNRHLAAIGENTARTAANTATTAEAIGETAESAKSRARSLLELSDSSDARKRLAQYGLGFDSRQFRLKLMAGDLEAQKLFYDAGMRADIHDRQGGMPIFAAILNNAPNWRESLSLAIKAGGFEPNRTQNIFIGQSLDPASCEEKLTRWLGGDSGLFAFFQPSLPEGRRNMNAGGFVALAEIIPSPETLAIIKETGLDLRKGAALREDLADQYENYANQLVASLNQLWLCESAKINDSIYGGADKLARKKAVAGPIAIGAPRARKPSYCPQEYIIDGFVEYRTGLKAFNYHYLEEDKAGTLKKIARFRQKIASLDLDGFRARLAGYRAGTRELLNAFEAGRNVK